MKGWRSCILCATAMAVPLLCGHPSDSPALQRVQRQLAGFYLDANAIPGVAEIVDAPGSADVQARDFAQSLDATGNWPDINYASKDESAWPPSIHYGRMLTLAMARLRESTPPAERATLTTALHRSFSYWVAHDFQSSNWWYNQIGAPKQLGAVGVLLGDELLSTERTYLVDTMLPRARVGMTGQNRIWLAGNTLTRGLLAGDAGLVDASSRVIWEELRITTGEGIQPDFSFQQHGPQQQFGNYGLGLAIEIARWATALRDTPWAPPSEAMTNYRHFILDGESWTVWRGRMDISACGRHLFPGSPVAKAAILLNVARHAARFDQAAATDYAALARRQQPDAANDLTGLRIFWRSDYVVQRRPDYSVTVKMSSHRVIGSESINHENLQGYHLGDGATYFYRNGDEYADLFPVWDWRKLPGVTCAQDPDELPRFHTYRVDGDFTGGVTNGTQGVAVLDYIRDGVSAHKAWFFDNDETILLGEDIFASGAQPIGTTINQCRRRGPVLVKRTNRPVAEQPSGRFVFTDVEWIEHDGWRYTFPPAQSVCLEIETRRGYWNRIYQNSTTPTAEVAQEVFTVWIDHGSRPDHVAYACIVGPAGGDAKARVLANRTGLQSVALRDGRTGFIFWQPGKADFAGTPSLAVNAPSLALLDKNENRLTVAEPTQKLSRLLVTLNGVNRSIDLPLKGNAGSSVEVRIESR